MVSRAQVNRISTPLAGYKLGMKEVDNGLWLASFMHYGQWSVW
jgi:hypothetical protein